MKIVAVETLRIAERPNLVWVRLRTDAGLTGLGLALLPELERRDDATLRVTRVH